VTSQTAAPPALTPQILAQRLRQLIEKYGRRPRPDAPIVVRHIGPWTGPETLLVGETQCVIRQCPSVLALREALRSPSAAGARLVLLTEVEGESLGQDALARIAAHRVHGVRSWDIVMGLFGLSGIDPALSQRPWLADALLEGATSIELPFLAGNTLDQETLFSVLLSMRFGLPIGRPDGPSLLRWALSEAAPSQFAALPEQTRADVRQFLERQLGATARVVFAFLTGDRPADLAAGVLVCELLASAWENEPAQARELAVALRAGLGGLLLERNIAEAVASGSRPRPEGQTQHSSPRVTPSRSTVWSNAAVPIRSFARAPSARRGWRCASPRLPARSRPTPSSRSGGPAVHCRRVCSWMLGVGRGSACSHDSTDG
jgi:hypothetical protein